MKPYQTLALALTGSVALVILVTTLAPPQTIRGFGVGDKVAHLTAFAALVMPVACLYRRALPWLLPLAILFGAGIEVVQPFVGRDAEFADLLADAIGVGIGAVAGLTLRQVLLRVLPERVLQHYWFWAMK